MSEECRVCGGVIVAEAVQRMGDNQMASKIVPLYEAQYYPQVAEAFCMDCGILYRYETK